METKRFEALLASARWGSFTRTAQELGCTQPALTNAMNALEQQVGFALLERGHYGTRLTEQGEQLRPAIERFLKAGHDLEAAIEAIRSHEQNCIRVGAYSSMAVHWLPAILQVFRTQMPGIRVDVRMGGIEELYEWVRTGEVELAFVSRQDDLKARFIPLQEDVLVAILPPEEETKGDTFPVQGFEGRDFLMPALGFNRDIMPMFKRNRVHPKIQTTGVDDPVVISMVGHGLGVSIMTELIMTGRPKTVQALPISPRVARELGMIVRAAEEPRRETAELIRCARETVGNLRNGKA